eukprot:CAMPEP_0196573718 /NCGR_PEP_ID=MMETSP1081-20130531/3572_1 /TAXON_ID=36882 /ORGANISM="Pyramimonas amylifera, Strain CCMP720" /LENGTH=283 /DNA_ID=CAMNT_0041891537 /DNA_START=24 /DNA_END=875 /DNA_ORIENTATION=-
MIPVSQRHSSIIGPGVVPHGFVPSESNAPGNVDANVPLVPSSGGAPFAITEHNQGGFQHTQYPYVTGTSILALKYKYGVMIACDMLGSYGSTKRYKSVERMQTVGKNAVLAASGECSDFKYILTLMDGLTTDDYCLDDGQVLTPQEICSYLTRVIYNRRNKFDPLWNSIIVGGVGEDGDSYLGTVGMIGTSYTDSHIATGFGAHLARPLFRERQYDDMPEDEAKALLDDALRVCYYRDKQSINKFQVANITKDGATISEPYALSTAWHYNAFVNPAAHAVGTW